MKLYICNAKYKEKYKKNMNVIPVQKIDFIYYKTKSIQKTNNNLIQ